MISNSPSSCKICGGTDLHLRYSLAQDYLTGEDFQVWQCQNCRVAFTFPQPEELSRYYPQKYRRYTAPVLVALRTLYYLRVQRWSHLFAKPGVAFEVGVGDGLMLDTLRVLGWRVIGNERTTEMAQFARHQLGLPVFAGDVDALQASPYFDLIILFQVLEHLDDPVRTLTQLSTRLKSDGKLIIGVPNFDSWQSSFGKSRWFHLDVPRHLFHYSPTSLGNCLNQIGMEVEHISYLSLEHDPYGWLQTSINKLDPKFNRLTRLLMKMDTLNSYSLANLLSIPLLGVATVELSLLSWVLRRGAMIEVVAHKMK